MAYNLAYVIFFVYLCTRKGLDSSMTTLTHSEKEAIMKDTRSTISSASIKKNSRPKW